MAVEITGFDEIGSFRERVEASDGEVPMTELFAPDFMQNYTEFATFEAFLVQSPWAVETQADFESIPATELDAYVEKYTGFDSWKTMLSVGGREYVLRYTE